MVNNFQRTMDQIRQSSAARHRNTHVFKKYLNQFPKIFIISKGGKKEKREKEKQPKYIFKLIIIHTG